MHGLAVDNLYLDQLYSAVFHYIVYFVALITILIYLSRQEENKLYNTSSQLLSTFLFVLCVALFLGLRTYFNVYIADTRLYDLSWNHIDENTGYEKISLASEWLFDNIQIFLWRIGARDSYIFFTTISFIYLFSLFWSCYRLMKDQIWLVIVICVVSFSFFSYGVNGIRQGVSCNLVLLGMTFIVNKNFKDIALGILLFFIASSFHGSSKLPILCALLSLFIIHDTKYSIIFWGLSIIVSLIAGNYFGDLFAELGFDDRGSYFIDVEESGRIEEFSKTGFRFDFLLYSSIPVLFVWYLTIKRNFKDFVFNLIANTYILSNAFWILVIRATYSNRFAYLSWFIYPILISYPLIRFNIWDNQNKKTALILFLYTGFSMFMYFIA